MTAETAAPEIPNQDITSFVLHRASELGDKPALIDGPTGRTITYGELAPMTEKVASALASRGIGKGDAVCIYAPNMPEYAVLFHGVIRAGAHNTTSNPLYTAKEMDHQLHDSQARLIFTVPNFLDTAVEAMGDSSVEEVVVLGADGEPDQENVTSFEDFLGSGDGEVPEVDWDPQEDLAVLPYSSGTTGLPKGVKLTHHNLVANVTQTDAAMQVEEDDVLIGVLPFFHIYGMTVIMNMGLWSGATVVTMPQFDLGGFLELVEKHEVTMAYVVPPIALALAKQPAIDDADLSSIRVIMSGAAPLSGELTEKVTERIGCPVIQGYGMTETSPVTHICPIDNVKPGTVGPPIPGTECRIVDPESGEDSDRGELWIRGPQVMAGYLNNEEETKDTLTDEGWLKTGDIAEVDDDGFYSIVDRLKELIKYKGYQVPPAELEGILIDHEAVADAAVIGVPDEEAGEIPKGFVVIAEGQEISDEEIMDYVAEQVSPQKKLRQLERLDEIPKSASGKILRKELRDG